MVAATTMQATGKERRGDQLGRLQVWTVRDGTAVRGAGVPKQGQALEAAGLRE